MCLLVTVAKLYSNSVFLKLFNPERFIILKIIEGLKQLLYGLYVSIFATWEIKTKKFLIH